MKNKILLLVLLLGLELLSPAAQAQTWDEWFHQDWTQGEYDKDQMAGLWMFYAKVKEGLKVVGNGLTTVSNISNGELNLHRDFFGARDNVSPAVNDVIDVIEIINFQIAIVRDMNRVYTVCRNSPHFSASEILYIERVHRNFLVLTDRNIAELLKILRPNELNMSDDERLEQIDDLCEEMRDQRAFVNSFGNEAMALSWQRQRDADAVSWSKSQYSIY